MAEIVCSLEREFLDLHGKRPSTIATCPHSQLLAVAPKAGYGGSSQQKFVALLSAEEHFDGRFCEWYFDAFASIPVADGDLNRLVWSWSSSSYKTGLLAGGFDGGVVCVWDPAAHPCFDASACDFDLPQVNKPTDVKMKKNTSVMVRDVERIYMNELEEDYRTEAEWEVVTMKAAALLDNKSSALRDGLTLLKIADLEGPVNGLAFNNQYPNMLAAAGKADKWNLYHIDYPVKDSTSKYEFADYSEKAKNARVTFMEWHPQHCAILASTSDAGITTIWDIRRKNPLLRFEDMNEYCTEVHWSPNNSQHLAVSSIGRSSETVKIWDSGNTRNIHLNLQEAMFQFGPKGGVTSFSWSAVHDLILTTDVGGGTDCWTVDGKKRVELSDDISNCLEARWCEVEHEFAVSTTTDVKLCKLLSPPVAM